MGDSATSPWEDRPHAAVLARLRAAGLDEWAIDCLRRATPRGLLDFQRRALVASGLLDGRPTLLLAPTSAGKTLLGELALWRAVAARRRGVYLAPTRALAEQVHAGLRTRYAALGRRILLATRDRPESDAAVRAGHFDVLVAIHEKAKAFASSGDVLRDVGCIVADELHALGDAGRGESLDLLLTAARRGVGTEAGAAPQLVALSTPGEDAAALAAWLGAETVTSTERPHPLFEGVFDLESRQFRSREADGFLERTEAIVPPACVLSCDASDHFRRGVLQVAASLALDARRQVMVFVPAREMAQEWARDLAATMGGDMGAPGVAEAVMAAGAGGLGAALCDCLRGGAAFHHAEMAPPLRTIVEEAFRAGAVRALVATSTLSQGVNLNGDVAISVPERVGAESAGGGRGAFVPLGRRRFVQQGGRAGRLREDGAPAAPGLSIVVTAGRGAAERLWDALIAAPVPPLAPLLDAADPASVVMHALALSGATTCAALVEFLQATWAGSVAWRRDPARLRQVIEAGTATLRVHHLLVAEPAGRLELTAQGRAASAAGLLPATAAALLGWIDTWEGRAPDALDALLRLAATPDGAAHAIRIAPGERRRIGYIAALRELFGLDERGGATSGLGACLPRPPHRPSPATCAQLERDGGHGPEDFAAAKKALAAAAWIGDAETTHVEESLAMYAGGFEQLGAHLAWLAEAAARLAEAKGLPPAHWGPLEALARRLPAGLGEEAAGLAGLGRASVSRDQMRRLAREGLATMEAVAEADEATLARCVGVDAARRVRGAVDEWRERRAHVSPPRPHSPTSTRPPSMLDEARLEGTPSDRPAEAVAPSLHSMDSPATLDSDTSPVAVSEGDESAELALSGPRSLTPTPASLTTTRSSEGHVVEGRIAEGRSVDGRGAEGRNADGQGRVIASPILLRLSPQNPGAVEVGGRAVTLSARQYALLAVLAERAGRCVPYETLMARAWHGAIVEQQQINQHKRGLIRRLSEVATLPTDFIETRPGIGLALLPSRPDLVAVVA